jgi:excisionase family DNA binding protein
MMAKLLNISQAAELLGVHENTLRNWTRKGYIPFVLLPSGHRRFNEAELLAFARKLQQGDRGLADKDAADHQEG